MLLLRKSLYALQLICPDLLRGYHTDLMRDITFGVNDSFNVISDIGNYTMIIINNLSLEKHAEESYRFFSL